jgi:hypothetical protein
VVVVAVDGSGGGGVCDGVWVVVFVMMYGCVGVAAVDGGCGGVCDGAWVVVFVMVCWSERFW